MANLCIKTPSSASLVLIFQLLALRPRTNPHPQCQESNIWKSKTTFLMHHWYHATFVKWAILCGQHQNAGHFPVWTKLFSSKYYDSLVWIPDSGTILREKRLRRQKESHAELFTTVYSIQQLLCTTSANHEEIVGWNRKSPLADITQNKSCRQRDVKKRAVMNRCYVLEG